MLLLLLDPGDSWQSDPRSNVGYVENAILFGRTSGRLARFSRDRRITLAVPAHMGDVTAELDVEPLLVELGDKGSVNLLSVVLLSFVDVVEDKDDDEREDFGRLIAVLRGRIQTLVGVVPEIHGGLTLPFEFTLLAMSPVFVMSVLVGVLDAEVISSFAKQGVKLSLSNEVVGNLWI